MTKDELRDRIEHNHRHHPPPDSRRETDHERVREATEICGKALINTCPTSRELSVALTKLEEVMFWANAAVARQDE